MRGLLFNGGARKTQLLLRCRGPDEADELSCERGDDLSGRLALVGEKPVAAMEPLLGSPGDRRHFRWEGLLNLSLAQTEMRTMTVVPGRFDEHSAQVGITGLGDLAATALGTTRVFRRHEARIAHDLGGALEAAEAAKLGGECDGRDLGDPAQGLECIDDGFEVLRCGLNGAVDVPLEALETLGLVVDLQDVVEQDGVLLGVGHLQPTQPLPPGRRPCAFRST